MLLSAGAAVGATNRVSRPPLSANIVLASHGSGGLGSANGDWLHEIDWLPDRVPTGWTLGTGPRLGRAKCN
jgi:hypothetical protein